MQTATIQQLDANGNPIAGLMSGSGWPVTHSHATAALASIAGVATAQHVITGFICSTDKASAVISVKSAATVKATVTVPAAGVYKYRFPTYIICPLGEAASVTIDGTSACAANLFGFTLTALPA